MRLPSQETPKVSESYIETDATNRPMSFVGEQAVHIFYARALREAIRLHQKTGLIPRRGVTITKMMKQTQRVTGQKFSIHQHEEAISALEKWEAEQVPKIEIRKGEGA